MTAPALDVSQLCFHYPDGVAALNGISLQVQPGESVGLVGPNGAGKTTLFLCLCGVLLPSQGTVRVFSLDPTQAGQRRQLVQKLGMVFQNPDDQLFCSSVFEDVAFGPLNLGLNEVEVRQRVTEALQRVGLHGLEERVPHHLSGGEKRRAALAGILAMQPDLLLLDEPSAHLDPRGRRELIKLLNSFPHTKLIASHDLPMLLDCCQRVLLLDQGRLIADGPPRQLFADARLMEEHGLEVPAVLGGSGA
jgi:cobalt/nickel transport system ATP-binding protein